MAFNSPGGSTLQWGVKQGVLCATLLVWFTTAVSMKRVVTAANYTDRRRCRCTGRLTHYKMLGYKITDINDPSFFGKLNPR